MIHIKLDKKAKDVISKTADLGSGSIVVNELPQVGEEHTIYELHTTTPSKFNYVPCINEMKFRYVFENEEAFRNFVRDFASHYTDHNEFFCYCLAEDELIRVYYNSGSANWTLLDKEEENIFIDNDERLCICKALIDENTALLLNGKQVHRGDSDGILYSLVLIHQVKSKVLCDEYKYAMIMPVMNSTLPSCADGEPYPPNTTDWSSGIVQWITNDGSIKIALPYVDGKYRYDKNEQYFYDSKTGEYYTGEFEWVDIEDFNFKDYVDYETYDSIPLGETTKKGEIFIFDPSGKSITSYWIYTNNEWVNIEDIGTIVLPVVSYGSSGKDNGLELPNFEFTVNGNKVDCVQYKINTAEGRTSYFGYITGISLPTENNTIYSISVRFIGDSSQISRSDCLALEAYDGPGNNMLEGPNILSGTMNIELTNINTLSIIFMGKQA